MTPNGNFSMVLVNIYRKRIYSFHMQSRNVKCVALLGE